MNNPFSFALAGAKEFFLNEVTIANLKIQNWVFFALAIAVVILILVIVSAAMHSKKNKQKSAEEETAAAQTDETTGNEAENTTVTVDATETEETATADGVETVTAEETETAEETATAEAPVITETAEETETVTETTTEETAETTANDNEETPVTDETAVTDETTETETVTVTETKAEEETAEEKPAAVTEEETAVDEKPVNAEETTSTEETATATTAEQTKKPAQKTTAKTTKPSAKKQRETKTDNTEEEQEMKHNKTKVTKNADLVFGADSSDKVDLTSAEKKTTRKKKTAAPEEKPVAVETPVVEEVAATENSAKVTGKFEICNSSIGGFRYHLIANNGQLLYESRDYKTYDSCADAIQKFINSVANGEFTVRADKFGNYKYHLKSATSNNIIYVGTAYSTKKSCLNSVESVKRFAPVSPVVDSTDPDFKATAAPFAIPDDVVKAVANKQGAVGKWVIDHVDSEDENSAYVFLLYANNGQLLYESREFTTYANCRKGMDTFVSTLENGYFIVDEDKFGRFKFFLRSTKAGSQAEYVGPTYTDRTSCGNSAISVYKFALLTPIVLD